MSNKGTNFSALKPANILNEFLKGLDAEQWRKEVVVMTACNLQDQIWNIIFLTWKFIILQNLHRIIKINVKIFYNLRIHFALFF